MKNIFGINVKTEKLIGERFKARDLDPQIVERQESHAEEYKDYQKKAKLPWYLRVLYYLCCIGLILCVGVIIAFLEILLEKFSWVRVGIFLSNAWWVLALGIAGLCGIFLLRYVARKKAESVVESEEYQSDERKVEQTLRETLENLKIPEDSVRMDIFLYPYKENKKGKMKSAGIMAQYSAYPARIYREEKHLCVADLVSVYEIPVEKFHKIVKINKTATFTNWNKEEEYNKGVYKPYKIRLNEYGAYWVKPYYSLQFTADNEEFELLFPPYELEVVQRLTGLNVEENN